MITRITSQMMAGSAQRSLQSAGVALGTLQNKASSQKQITRPSDNPVGTADALAVRAQQRATTQYGNNISDGLAWLATVDSSMSAATDVMQRVRDLTVQGANTGALSQDAREAIALELESLRPELLAQANTKYAGRPVFAGNTDAGVAFNPDLSFNGVTGSTVERRIDASTTVQVDASGSAAFGAGATSAFALIDTIVTDLRAGSNIGTHLAAIDSRMTTMLGEQAKVGARYSQLERSKELNMEQSGSLESQRSGIEDVDLGQVILELKMQETAYQAALAVTARSLQPTLMSFLS
jgi:flagellar hook-associated protein 3 FlgL